MNNVAEGTVGILSAGHHYEILVPGVDDLDVVKSQRVVKSDGDNSLHGTVV